MFDNSEEDKDLDSQVSKASSSGTSKDDHELEVVGSPVTPEKLDPSMDLDRKAMAAAGEQAKSGEGSKAEETKKEA